MPHEEILIWSAMLGLLVFMLIICISPFAERLKLIDLPDARKRHKAAVPTVGGLAIFLAVVIMFLLLEMPINILWALFASLIVVAVGAIDDAFRLGVRTRIASQVIATSLVILAYGLWIKSLGVNFLGFSDLSNLLGIPLTIFAVVGLTNGFNMVDGIDGLAAGHMLIGILTVSAILLLQNDTAYNLEILVISASIVFAFWLVNTSLTPIEKVFLGDAGSMFLGFGMSWILIWYSQEATYPIHPVAALWCVTIPVFDTLTIIIRRVKSKKSPFSPDRNHLHYLLIDLGFDPSKVLFIILMLSILLNAFGVTVTYLLSPEIGFITYGILFLAFAFGMLNPAIERKRVSEMSLTD